MEYKKTIATLKQADAFLDVIGYNSEEFKQNVKDSLKEIEKAINYTRCCTELCDCAMPDPIDPFTEVDKDTCRKCKNFIA